MTTISLSSSGFLDKAKVDRTFGLARKEMIRRATAGMRHSAPGITARVQANVGSALKGNRAAKSIKAKVWNQKADRFPALQISSKIPWLGVHEHGKTLRGKMLIQIGRGKRSGRKAFSRLVDTLMAQKLAFFKKGRDGKVYLFARPQKGVRGTAGARRVLREELKAQGGSGRIGRDNAIPIAILVTRITIPRRLNVAGTINKSLPSLVRAMEVAT